MTKADPAADPIASCQRSYTAGTVFPLGRDIPCFEVPHVSPGTDGPYIGVCHTRRFPAVAAEGWKGTNTAEGRSFKQPIPHLGESVDLGPVQMYAYEGSRRTGGMWLRQQRRAVPFRSSPAEWYQRSTFLGEEN